MIGDKKPMSDGWNCPHCGKAHAPWVMTCPSETKTWTSNIFGDICEHRWITDTGGTRCELCGKQPADANFQR